MRALYDSHGLLDAVQAPSGHWFQSMSRGGVSSSVPHPIRLQAIAVIESHAFEAAVLFAIFGNCAFLAIQGPPGSTLSPEVEYVWELCFVLLFTADVCCKIVAMGAVMDSTSFLRSRWNQVDFLVVVAGWLPFLMPQNSSSLTAVRAVRALRPLRTLTHFAGMRRQIDTLVLSLPKLADVGLLILFVVCVFGVLGLQLFQGALLYRCYLDDGRTPTSSLPVHPDAVCSAGGEPGSQGTCAAGEVCLLHGANPFGGTVGYDDIGGAVMTTVMCMTLEGWSDVMYMMMDAVSEYAAIYYVILVLFGSFYVINLFLAVLWQTYQSRQADVPEETAPSSLSRALKAVSGRLSIAQRLRKQSGELRSEVSALRAAAEASEAGAAAEASALRTMAALAHEPSTLAHEPSAAPSAASRYFTAVVQRGAGGALDDLPPPPTAFHGLAPSAASSASSQALLPAAAGRSDASAAGSQPPWLARSPPDFWRSCDRFLDSDLFRVLVLGLVCGNTLVMAMERHPSTPELDALLADSNLAFTLLFTAEMALKLAVRGAWRYWSDPFDRFDGFVVVTGLVELVARSLYELDALAVQELRLFRLLRIFKLARQWRSLRVVLRSLLEAMASLQYLFMILVLTIFIFAVMGMQLFGGKLAPSADAPDLSERLASLAARNLYDSFANAMVTVFVVISVEDWNDYWVVTHRAVGPWSAAYYILLLLIGNYLVLNLVVAVVIGGYVSAAEQQEKYNAQVAAAVKIEAAARGKAVRRLSVAGETSELLALSQPKTALDQLRQRLCGCLDGRANHALYLFPPSHPIRRLARLIVTRPIVPGTGVTFTHLLVLTIAVTTACSVFVTCDVVEDVDGASFQSLEGVERELFEQAERLDVLVLWLSLVEVLANAIAYGLYSTPNAYLHKGWNQLDFGLVLASAASVVWEQMAAGGLSLMTLRSLRLLKLVAYEIRLVAHVSGLRQVVNLLVVVMPRVVNVMLCYMTFLLVFGILGVQLFAGHYASCRAPDGSSVAGRLDRTACLEAGYEWANPASGSFDDIGSAMLLLFEMSSLEGWPLIMYAGIDSAPDESHPPTADRNVALGLFFVLWVLSGGMVLLNLFVGVLVEAFADVKREQAGTPRLLSEDQKQWAATFELMLTISPQRSPPCPPGHCRASAWRVVMAEHFESVVLGVILFNTALMGLDGYHNTDEQQSALLLLNVLCTLFFCAEATLKLLALSPSGYFADGWNVFDLTVVAISLVDLSATLTYAISPAVAVGAGESALQPTLLRVLRLTRILRTMRAIKSSRGLRMLLTTLFTSLPALANVLGVFLLMQFTFSVLGMHLFRHVHWADEHADFCTFGGAFLTMFRCATGEGWNSLMHQAMVPSERCSEASLARGDCGSWLAIPFFVGYVVLTSFVVLKMIVALIIENFVLSLKQEGSRIQHRHTAAFVKAWGQHDPFGTGRIALEHLFGVLQSLPPPLGLDPSAYPNCKIRDSDLSRFILSLGLKAHRPTLVASASVGAADHLERLYDGKPFVIFYEVLGALLEAAFGDVLTQMRGSSTEAEVLSVVAKSLKERLGQKAEALSVHGGTAFTDALEPDEDKITVAHHYASWTIQRKARARAERRAAAVAANPMSC